MKENRDFWFFPSKKATPVLVGQWRVNRRGPVRATITWDREEAEQWRVQLHAGACPPDTEVADPPFPPVPSPVPAAPVPHDGAFPDGADVPDAVVIPIQGPRV